MAFTTTELDLLKQAFAAGALSVTFEGKKVDYGNATDLMKRIRLIEAELAGLSAGKPLPVAGFASYRRG